MFSREVLVFPTDNMQQDTVLINLIINLILMTSVKMGNAIEITFFCIF